MPGPHWRTGASRLGHGASRYSRRRHHYGPDRPAAAAPRTATGIDAPEAPSVRAGIEAAPLGSGVRKHRLGGIPQAGPYKRILGKVLVNGADAGLNQLQSGLAWHYKRYKREQSPEDRVAYARAEEKARASGAVLARFRPGSSAGTDPSAADSPSRPRCSTGSRRPSARRSLRSAPATTSLRRKLSRSSANPAREPRAGRDALGARPVLVEGAQDPLQHLQRPARDRGREAGVP